MSNGKKEPPKRPAPPRAGIPSAKPADTSPEGKVRRLLAELRKRSKADRKKITEIEAEIEALSVAELWALEKSLVGKFSTDLKEHGQRLRNLFRFSRRNKQPYVGIDRIAVSRVKGAATPKPVVIVTNLKDPKALRKGDPQETVRLTVHADGAFHLDFTGDAKEAYWLQFIWRMIQRSADTGAQTLQKRITRGGRAYLYTNDRRHPRWTIDGKDPAGPFYEGKTPMERTNRSIKMADLPTANDIDIPHWFDEPTPPKAAISTFHAETYLVRRAEVLFRSDIEIQWTITGKSAPTKVVVPVAKGRVTDRMEGAHRAALALQFPDWDYFPGPAMPPPVPMDDFEPISPARLAATKWPTGATPLERLKAAATIADAKLIIDVIEHPDTQVLTIHNDKVAPGLAFKPDISKRNSAGETAYLPKGTSQDQADLPLDRFAPLPDVVMMMGSLAFADASGKFERDRAFTLTVLRHEMEHAASNRTSIGWLIKWRDELTKATFPDWLAAHRKKGEISGPDYERALTFIRPKLNHATEALARVEGIITAMPFLEEVVPLSALDREGKWPPFLFELQGLLKQLPTLRLLDGSKPPVDGLMATVEKRLRAAVCEVVDGPHRQRVRDWLTLLVDFETRTPTNVDAVKLLKVGFATERKFIESILKWVDACTKPRKR